MTDSEAVWQFLSDLKDQREVERRLNRKAEDNPEAVLKYIETLPEGWDRQPTDEVTLLKRLEITALRTVQAKKSR